MQIATFYRYQNVPSNILSTLPRYMIVTSRSLGQVGQTSTGRNAIIVPTEHLIDLNLFERADIAGLPDAGRYGLVTLATNISQLLEQIESIPIRDHREAGGPVVGYIPIYESPRVTHITTPDLNAVRQMVVSVTLRYNAVIYT